MREQEVDDFAAPEEFGEFAVDARGGQLLEERVASALGHVL